MKKSLLLLTILCLVMTACTPQNNTLTPTQTSDVTPAKTAEITSETKNQNPELSVTYLAYDPDLFVQNADNTRILFFHAKWCPTCIAADKALTTESSRLPSNVRVFKTDYDSETKLIKQYSVTQQHTFVLVDAEGNAVDTWIGGDVQEILDRL